MATRIGLYDPDSLELIEEIKELPFMVKKDCIAVFFADDFNVYGCVVFHGQEIYDPSPNLPD